MTTGYLALILHAHLPFVRHPEHEDALEEHWLFEAVTECYVPLLTIFNRLLRDGIDFRVTMTVTPTLAAMLEDSLLGARYLRRLERLIELGEKESRRTGGHPSLAARYHRRLQNIRTAYTETFKRDLLGAFRALQRAGVLEIMASAATHAYLPMYAVAPAALRAQITTGVSEYKRVFGRRPRGFWLPECAYIPEAEALLKDCGITYYILEAHGITRSAERPRYGVYAPLRGPSGVAAFGRDPESSKQVWSALDGYPGDPDYREFYRDIGHELDRDYIGPYIHPAGIRIDTGFKYCRISGSEQKLPYDAKAADRKARLHAADFISHRTAQIDHLRSLMKRPPIITAPYDAELFGHWWYEGPRWIDHLFRQLARQKRIIPITPREYLRRHRELQQTEPAVSSWGYKGFHEVWLSGGNDWIYRHLHQGTGLMAKLAGRHPRARGLRRRALNAAARELLLAQASDWPFMIKNKSMASYATMRLQTHLERLEQLIHMVEDNAIDERRLYEIESRTTIFPDISYRVFAEP